MLEEDIINDEQKREQIIKNQLLRDQNDDVEDEDEDLWEQLDTMSNNQVKSDKNICGNCKSSNIIKDHSKGCVRCLDCASCSGQIFDNKPEWSCYEDGKNEGSARCGQPTSFYFPKSSMCTTIGGRQRSIIKTLNLWEQMPYNEYSLSKILTFIDNVCSKNYLPKAVTDNAKLIYKQVHDKRIIIRNFKNRSGIYGGCIFYGAQMQHYYRSTYEIAQMLNVSETDITAGRNKLKKILRSNKLLNSIVPTTPIDFIERYCYMLKLERDQIDIVCTLTRNITKLYLASNHQPMSVGASCVLIYAHIYNVDIPKKLILDTFNITAVTTDKIFNKILPFCDVIVSDEITNMVRDKLIESKYIAVDSDLQTKLDDKTEEFKQELLQMNQEILDVSAEDQEEFDNALNATELKAFKKAKRALKKANKLKNKN